jgi:hypothetical protein
MHPTTDATQTDRQHVFSSRADEELAHAYGQIKRADEQLGRMQQQLSSLKRDAARYRPRPSPDRPWLRGLIGLLIAACIVAAALLSQSPYGDAFARWAPQHISPSSLPLKQMAATDSRAITTQRQVTAATAVAERVTAATAVAILMARPEIKSLPDLAGRSIAIDDRQSAVSSNVRSAMGAAGAAEVQLTASETKAVDRIIGGEVPASVLTLASPEAAEGFPEIAGFKIFRVPLSERSMGPALTNGKG